MARHEWRDLSDPFFTPRRPTLQTFGIGTYFGTLSDQPGSRINWHDDDARDAHAGSASADLDSEQVDDGKISQRTSWWLNEMTRLIARWLPAARVPRAIYG